MTTNFISGNKFDIITLLSVVVVRQQETYPAKEPLLSEERFVKCLVVLADEVLGLAEKDVDLRNLAAASPTKKRPSMENVLDVPPAKKPKSEVIDE